MAIFGSSDTTEIKKSAKERINPMVIRDSETGEAFELDFTRETVRWAESRGFDVSQVASFPVTRIPELFFYAFRKNHKNVARSQTDEMLTEKLGGLKPEHLERLIQLYTQPYDAVIASDEGDEKNSKMAVEL